MSLGSRGLSIRWLLVLANATALLAPLLIFLGFRAYDVVLLRETEEKLIHQGVLVGEAWRLAWSAEHEQLPSDTRPAGQSGRYTPYEAQITITTPVLPHVETPLPVRPPGDTPDERAGRAIEPMLKRAQIYNMSGARVLGTDGCVLASSGEGNGLCMGTLPEVKAALAGQYASVLRPRSFQSPPPPLDGISRSGRHQVFVAMPIMHDGRVIGAVRMARTSMSTLEYLWKNRKGVLVLIGLGLFFVLAVSFLSYRLIAAPVRAIAKKAEAVARGGDEPLALSGFAPSEVQSLSLALDHMTRELKGRADYVMHFANDVAHELKSPITAIRGAAELLTEPMSDEQRARFVKNIHADAERMDQLIGRLLTLARIDARSGTGRERCVLDSFLDGLRASFPTLLVKAPDALGAVAIDEGHLRSALGNLIENGLRHGTHVALTVREEGSRISFEVVDDGPGIPPEHRAHIFDRFYTTERARGGTGLGLAIARAVAESQGGTLDVTSEPGRTCFRLVLSSA